MSVTNEYIESIYRSETTAVLATLIRLLNGNFDLAEEALHDAFLAALRQWPQEGIPNNPRAWLVSTGRFKAIDRIRRANRQQELLAQYGAVLEELEEFDYDQDDNLADDQLRLIFTCCHPALALEVQVALTLREVCGLTTEEIAAAFLVPTPTLAQRIVRAKTKIRDAGISYEVPAKQELNTRLQAVLVVVYLVFNEGYSPSNGDRPVNGELTDEAIRLGRLLVSVLPHPEVKSLLALMLLQASRIPSRVSPSGELILLEQQDRNLWHKELIAEGTLLVEQALTEAPAGEFALQSAIAAVHAEAKDFASTDWAQIVGLYDVLLHRNSSPIIALNRAVAVAMWQGPEAGLALIENLLPHPELAQYHLSYAAKAELHRQLGQTESALAAFKRALALAKQQPEQRYLRTQISALEK